MVLGNHCKSASLLMIWYLTCLNFLSAATDEPTVRVDQSDEDDAGSSDYFADAETSSCTSLDSDLSWPKISENKGR